MSSCEVELGKHYVGYNLIATRLMHVVCRMVGVSKETLLADLIKNGKINSWGEAPCYFRACKSLLLNQKLYNTLYVQ